MQCQYMLPKDLSVVLTIRLTEIGFTFCISMSQLNLIRKLAKISMPSGVFQYLLYVTNNGFRPNFSFTM